MSFTVTLKQEITNHDIAEEFVGSSSGAQAEMLCAMSRIVSEWPTPWAFQCRSISNEIIDPKDRADVAFFLQELIDHLNDFIPACAEWEKNDD
jgi:hypothetical protein